MKASDRIMSKVMGLLNLANDPNTSQHERDLAAEHAERLMAQHTIDRMDLTPEEKSSIIKDTWDIRTGDAGSEFSYHVRDLAVMILQHCNVRVNPSFEYVKNEDGYRSFNTRRYTIVGFPEDIGYAEQIWFRVFKEFVSNINPQWDVSLPLSENVYQFIRAGFSWIDTYRIGRKAQYADWPVKMPNGAPALRKAYKAALASRGEEWSKTKRREAYRNNFVQSYASTIRQRLDDIRAKAKGTVSDADKFALAIVDTKEQVDAEFFRLFPEYDPEVRRRMQENEAFEAACAWAALSEAEQAKVLKDQEAKEARWRRSAARARVNYGRVRENPRDRYDHDAWERGKKVASKVNLSVDPEVKRPKKKGEIG